MSYEMPTEVRSRLEAIEDTMSIEDLQVLEDLSRE